MVLPQICSAMNSRSITMDRAWRTLHVVERRLGRVHDEEPGAEIRAELHLVAEALLERLHLVGRQSSVVSSSPAS